MKFIAVSVLPSDAAAAGLWTILRMKDFVMGWLVSPQSSYVESQPPVSQSVTLFGDRVFREVIKLKWDHYCCCSVIRSCPALCDPRDCSMPGLPVSVSPEVCSDSCLLSWCYLTTSSSAAPHSFCLRSSPASGSFPVSQLFASGGPSIGASASVLSVNIQGWFPSGLTGLFSISVDPNLVWQVSF